MQVFHKSPAASHLISSFRNAVVHFSILLQIAVVSLVIASFGVSTAFAASSNCEDDLVGDFDPGCELGEMCNIGTLTCLPNSGDGGDDQHTTICHRPPGCPGNTRTITVGNCAVASHLAHGDRLGECPECSNDGDCPGHDVCNPYSGICQEPDGPCDSDGDCGGGQVCNDDTGTCQDPDGPCSDDSDCGSDQVCIGDPGTCQDPDGPCSDDSDCGGAQLCNDDTGTCQDPDGPCSDESDCVANQVCNAMSGLCQDPGGPCVDDSDCGSGQVCNDDTWTCQDPDAPCSDDSDCAGAQVCNHMSGLCQDPGGPCVDDSDCGSGQVCNDDTWTCQDPDGPCSEDADCGGTQVCNPETDSCQDPTSECAVDLDCDDGVFCNGSEVCHAALGCRPGTAPCNDAVACTVDGCDENTDSCSFTPSAEMCDDGLFCSGAETCDAQAGCLSGDPIDCSSMGSMCGDGECSEETRDCSMQPKNEGAICAVAQDACVVENVCAEGSCLIVPFCNTECQRCDLDGDGISWCASLCGNPNARDNDDVNTTDALFNLRASVGLEECNLCICDVTGDGKITAVDTLLMLRFIVGLENEFLCPDTAFGTTTSTTTTTLP